jgi:hypothetical protein
LLIFVSHGKPLILNPIIRFYFALICYAIYC